MNIVLASGSPRRKELLERIGIRNFEIVQPDVDETLQEGLPCAEQVEMLSKRKAKAAAERVAAGSVIIAADTVVAMDGKILGKPSDRQEAQSMLTSLAGAKHQVYTGVTVLQGDVALTRSEKTDVQFRPLRDEEVECYLDTGEYTDKAGAYGIQGYGALLVEGICGDYYNVMGLPVACLAQMLKLFDVDCLKLAAG